jgi:hypothetical protein
MLDRLPAEILDEVLLAATSPPPSQAIQTSIELERERSSLLSSLCLVSSALRASAQELLWRDLELRRFPPRLAKFAAVLQTKRGAVLAKATRTIRALHAGLPLVHSLLKVSTNVRELHVEDAYQGHHQFDLRMLQKLPSQSLSSCIFVDTTDKEAHADLVKLGLFSIETVPLSHPILLPSLTSLSLNKVTIPEADFAQLLHSDALPSLKAVAANGCYKQAPLDCFCHDITLDPLLLSGLDMIQHKEPGLPSLHCPPTVTAFVTFSFLREPQDPPPRSRLLYRPSRDELWTVHAGYDSGGIVYTLGCLAASIPTLLPLSLHLPVFLRSITPARPLSPWRLLTWSDLWETRRQVDEVLEACAKAGVEVVWSEDLDTDDRVVSLSCWRHAKGLKAKQAVEQ